MHTSTHKVLWWKASRNCTRDFSWLSESRICLFCIHAEFYRTVPYYQQIVRSSYSGILDSSHSPHLPVAPTNPFLVTLPPPDSQQLCICVLLACLCGFAPAAHWSFPLCHLDVSFPFTWAFHLPTLWMSLQGPAEFQRISEDFVSILPSTCLSP